MAENKTKQTKASVDKFINSIKEETERENCYKIIKLMKSITKEEPKMWGPSIIGFGSYHYKYASGREGDNIVGNSARMEWYNGPSILQTIDLFIVLSYVKIYFIIFPSLNKLSFQLIIF